MKTALVGHTGFVGSNLLRQTSFDDLYRSTDIDEIAGRRYALAVCAGAPAEKWKANRDPEADRAGIERLLAALERAEIEELVLISTVDVYPEPVGVDEATRIDPAAGPPYGRHRLELERRLAARFPTRVLRLPGLFGPGIKKNVVYDFLHHNALERIPADGVFQFYPLARLWADVGRVRAAGLELVNLATEPVSVREIAREAFGFEFESPAGLPAPRYDFRTRYAGLFGGRDGYLLSREQVLDALRRFVDSQGWRRP
jgi:nucleoside-diphosphate-sugar epimerase